MKIAVFNTEARKAVPIVRSLGAAGHTVYSFSFERISFAGCSRFVKRNTFVPSYDVDFVSRQLARNGIDVIFPIEDPSIEFFITHRDSFSRYILIAPELAAFTLFADKAHTVKHALERGVASPETFIPSSRDEAETYLRERSPYPRLIKPRRATSAIGVKIVHSAAEAIEHYRALSERFHLPIIQEYIPPGGVTVGAEFLMYRGREILTFCHERIREFPVRRGPSTYCKNYSGHDALAEGRKLLNGLEYSGFAMVEFKRHPDTGALYLMEVNPRPWGSITLPISAGVDFPREAVRVFSDPDRYTGPLEGGRYDPSKDYYMRWLLPGDILSILCDPEMTVAEKTKDLLRRYPDTAYQILSIGDPMPAVVIALKLFLNLFSIDYIRKYLLRKW